MIIEQKKQSFQSLDVSGEDYMPSGDKEAFLTKNKICFVCAF